MYRRYCWDAGDYSVHEPGKAHVKHHESALLSTIHHAEGKCGRFHALRSHPTMQLLDGTDKVVLVTGAAGFIGSHTARCVALGSLCWCLATRKAWSNSTRTRGRA